MRSEQLTIVFKLDAFTVGFALDGIQSVLTERGVPLDDFKLDGEPVKLTEARARLKKAKRKTFNIVGRGFEFDLSSIHNFRLDFLKIKLTDEHRSAWDKWAARFIGNPDFVMAWLADAEYEFWENAEDLLQYASKGKPHDHLPKKSNALPPPLEQTIVDVSGNPGRRLLRTGYYEVVGAVMWLGEPFWCLTGADKISTEQAQWLRVANPLPGVVRIEAATECFTTGGGHTGEIQRRLRSLLFPQQQ